MGTVELTNKVNEYKELKMYLEEVQAELESLKDEIKAEMERQGKDELTAGVFIVRWKQQKQSRFDTKAFQRDHAELYEEYKRETIFKKFTVD